MTGQSLPLRANVVLPWRQRDVSPSDDGSQAPFCGTWDAASGAWSVDVGLAATAQTASATCSYPQLPATFGIFIGPAPVDCVGSWAEWGNCRWGTSDTDPRPCSDGWLTAALSVLAACHAVLAPTHACTRWPHQLPTAAPSVGCRIGQPNPGPAITARARAIASARGGCGAAAMQCAAAGTKPGNSLWSGQSRTVGPTAPPRTGAWCTKPAALNRARSRSRSRSRS